MDKATESPSTNTRFGGHVVKRPYVTDPTNGEGDLAGPVVPLPREVSRCDAVGAVHDGTD